MLGVGLALALCNRTMLFGSSLAHRHERHAAASEASAAPRECAKYFDWGEFSQLATPLRTLSIARRNVSQTGGKLCVTTHEYFQDASHSWYWEQGALRALGEAGAIEISEA